MILVDIGLLKVVLYTLFNNTEKIMYTFNIWFMIITWILMGLFHVEVIAALQVADLTWGKLVNMYY